MVRSKIVTLTLLVCACGDAQPGVLTLQLVARDGEDPIAGAVELRAWVQGEDEQSLPPSAVDESGFRLDLDAEPSLRRVRLELADDAGVVVARGATPEAPLGLLAGFTVGLLVSAPGTAGGLALTDLPALEAAAPLGSAWILGLDPSGSLAMLDLLTYAAVPGLPALDPPRPGAQLVALGELRTLLVGGGPEGLVYDGSTNVMAAASPGADWNRPVLVSLPQGGALALCDGADEVVAFDGLGAVAWRASLSVARTGCAAALAGSRLVVHGGGGLSDPATEWLDLDTREAHVLGDEADPRRGAAAVGSGSRVFVLGGATGQGPRGDGVVLDLDCADGCPVPLALGAARATVVAALSRGGGTIVLAGEGTADLIDATTLEVTTIELPSVLETEGPAAALAVGTGDVWLLGGPVPVVVAPP